MANKVYKYRGTKQPISFGVEKLEGFIVDATEETIEGEELEVENVIPLVGAVAPNPGDEFKIGEKFSFIVKSVKKSRAKKDIEKWDLEGTYYPEIPMDVVG